MAEINVNINEINNAIKKLQNLRARCKMERTATPITVGGGKTVNELEDIAEVYKSLNSHFEELIANTVLFLQNVRDSYTSSDKKAADGMKK